MEMKVKEFANYVGVSVRTVHYYDEINLLKPAFVDKLTGYRYYNEDSLLRMQEIMFFRELDFALKDILSILSSPDYDKIQALNEQKKLLNLKKERLENIISAIDNATKGENIMKSFDNTAFDSYKSEVKEKWGNTSAYKEHEAKAKGYSKDKWQNITVGLNNLMAEFALCLKNGNTSDSLPAQELVKKLQTYITDNYYTCTKEILAGLGKMYVADDRFKNNIDSNGEGTAEFISKAIEIYCK